MGTVWSANMRQGGGRGMSVHGGYGPIVSAAYIQDDNHGPPPLESIHLIDYKPVLLRLHHLYSKIKVMMMEIKVDLVFLQEFDV